MDDIIKMVGTLGNLGWLLNGASKKVKHEIMMYISSSYDDVYIWFIDSRYGFFIDTICSFFIDKCYN